MQVRRCSWERNKLGLDIWSRQVWNDWAWPAVALTVFQTHKNFVLTATDSNICFSRVYLVNRKPRQRLGQHRSSVSDLKICHPAFSVPWTIKHVGGWRLQRLHLEDEETCSADTLLLLLEKLSKQQPQFKVRNSHWSSRKLDLTGLYLGQNIEQEFAVVLWSWGTMWGWRLQVVCPPLDGTNELMQVNRQTTEMVHTFSVFHLWLLTIICSGNMI